MSSCLICQREKSNHTISKGQLQNPELLVQKWQEVSIDFVTNLPVVNNFDSIMTVIDKATWMTHLIPCSKTVTVQETAQYYFKPIARLQGVTKFIYTARGTQFTSKFWKELRGLFGTGVRFSTAFHPQTQGLMERIKAVIGQMLCCALASLNERKNWVDICQLLNWPSNSMPNQSTGYSPSYLNYGYHPRVPSDLIDGSETTQNEFLNGFIKRMDFDWNQSVTQMKNIQELQGRYYNKHHRMMILIEEI